MKNVRTLIFGLSMEEATFERRGFSPCSERAQARLERVGKTFLEGYLAALRATTEEGLHKELEQVELERRGFAYEGSAMALGLMDILLPWRRDRWSSFTRRFAQQHIYMMHVGLGWALARLRRRPDRYLARLDPLVCWLALDGYGFHECYFNWRRVMLEHRRPARLSGYALNAFDQGVGRALWFVNGADGARIAEVIGRFPSVRRGDLWSGVGLAAAYAGGVDEDSLRALAQLSGSHHRSMAQGVLFATETRINAGNLATHTTLACRVICGITADRASEIVTTERRELPYGGDVPAYEIWRHRIQSHFSPGSGEPIPVVPDGTLSGPQHLDYHSRRSSDE